MAIAAHVGAIKVSATIGGSYTEADGIKSYTIGMGNADLDTTDFKDTTGSMQRILGLSDTPVSLEGDFEPGDTTGQGIIFDAFVAKTAMGVQILPDGTNGFQVEVLCTKFEIKAGVADTVSVSIELVSTGVVTII